MFALVAVTLPGCDRSPQAPRAPVQKSAAPEPRKLTLDQRLERLRPKPAEEKFMQIPWRTDLLAAREEAQQAGKPLFMWAMDGNPLGLV